MEYSHFTLDENKTDLDNVLEFLESTPSLINLVVENRTFIDIINEDQAYNITFELFYNAFREAIQTLNQNIDFIRQITSRESENFAIEIENIYAILNTIGFSGDSLKLKLRLHKKLWKRVTDASNSTVDFFSNPVVRLLRKALTFLNSMLGSLTKLIPGADAIKEIKEVIESYLNLNDN